MLIYLGKKKLFSGDPKGVLLRIALEPEESVEVRGGLAYVKLINQGHVKEFVILKAGHVEVRRL